LHLNCTVTMLPGLGMAGRPCCLGLLGWRRRHTMLLAANHSLVGIRGRHHHYIRHLLLLLRRLLLLLLGLRGRGLGRAGRGN
jgi:hypothetical protein